MKEERAKHGCETSKKRMVASDKTRPRGHRFHAVLRQKLFQTYQF